MYIAVLGLGMEGKNAVYSLLDYGHQVYASDLDMNLKEKFNECYGELEIDLGKHDWKKINNADAIVVSPSLWKSAVLEKIVSKNKILLVGQETRGWQGKLKKFLEPELDIKSIIENSKNSNFFDCDGF